MQPLNVSLDTLHEIKSKMSASDKKRFGRIAAIIQAAKGSFFATLDEDGATIYRVYYNRRRQRPTFYSICTRADFNVLNDLAAAEADGRPIVATYGGTISDLDTFTDVNVEVNPDKYKALLTHGFNIKEQNCDAT